MPVDIAEQKIEDMDAALTYNIDFLLWPTLWEGFNLDFSDKKWKGVKFIKNNRTRVPTSRGIYSFIIVPNIAKHPCNYLIYVGQSIDLNRRFKDYLQEQKGNGKPRWSLVRVLRKYKYNIKFTYIELSDDDDLDEIEAALLKAFIPRYNTAFPAEVTHIAKVLR